MRTGENERVEGTYKKSVAVERSEQPVFEELPTL